MNEKIATRIIFFIAGVATATWAVLVPFARFNTGVNEGLLGTLLLCLGFGAMLAMPVTGTLTSRYGCRSVIIGAVAVVVVSMPFLSFVSSPSLLGISLFIFGVGIGLTDCAMNVQAILVEKNAGKPLMSGFHGMYSVGGIAGAGIMTGLLSLELSIFSATVIISVIVCLLLLSCFRQLLTYANPAEGPAFAMPRGTVLILGLICFIVFMAEGTVLDWSAVYLVDIRNVPESLGGLGFAAFATAMTAGRLAGDYVVRRLGALTIVLAGAVAAIVGFLIVIYGTHLVSLLAGYLLIGIGCANIVPVMFSQIGKQTSMSQMVAVPAVTTLGYIGVLSGPAVIGYIAHHSRLAYGFIFVAVLLLIAFGLTYSIRNLLKSGQSA